MPLRRLRSLCRAFSHSRPHTKTSTTPSVSPTHPHTHTTTMAPRILTLSDIPTWENHVFDTALPHYTTDPSLVNTEANKKISVFVGDITKLEIDAIVNAANRSLLGGGGVDGAIHRAAGTELYKYCKTLHGCNTGESKILAWIQPPSNTHVIHTVGPTNGDPEALRSCYETALSLLLENKLRSIAFCCVSTGIYGFPNEPAADIATDVVKEFLEKHGEEVDRIIFCLFLPVDVKIYEELLQEKFPCLAPKKVDRKRSNDDVEVGETKEEEKKGEEIMSPRSPKMQKMEKEEVTEEEKAEAKTEEKKEEEEKVDAKKEEEVKNEREVKEVKDGVEEADAKKEEGEQGEEDEK